MLTPSSRNPAGCCCDAAWMQHFSPGPLEQTQATGFCACTGPHHFHWAQPSISCVYPVSDQQMGSSPSLTRAISSCESRCCPIPWQCNPTQFGQASGVAVALVVCPCVTAAICRYKGLVWLSSWTRMHRSVSPETSCSWLAECRRSSPSKLLLSQHGPQRSQIISDCSSPIDMMLARRMQLQLTGYEHSLTCEGGALPGSAADYLINACIVAFCTSEHFHCHVTISHATWQ